MTFRRDASANLGEELARLQQEVRSKPSDEKLRTYLFQLLAVQGQWQRALGQLQACAQLSAATIPMAQTYREALRSELLRTEVFAGRRKPQILGEPPEWAGLLIEALGRLAQGDAPGAATLRGAAFDAAPASRGMLNDDASFEWIADADMRLGPICEAIVNGQYYWVPFFRLREIRIEPPADLRDMVWAVATLTLANGGEQVALIPARYPGTESCADDALKVGRGTEWRDAGGGTFVGLGQKMFATDTHEYALLDVRKIELEASAA